MVVVNDHGGSPFGFDKIWLKDGLKHSSAFHNPSDRKVEKVRRRQKRIFQSPSLFPTDNFFEIGGECKKSFSAKQSVCLKTLSLDNGQNEAGCHGSVTSGSKKKRLPFWQALQNGVGYSIISSKNSSFSCINRRTPSASSRCCKSCANAR